MLTDSHGIERYIRDAESLFKFLSIDNDVEKVKCLKSFRIRYYETVYIDPFDGEDRDIPHIISLREIEFCFNNDGCLYIDLSGYELHMRSIRDVLMRRLRDMGFRNKRGEDYVVCREIK